MKYKTLTTLLAGALLLSPFTLLHSQTTQRLKSVIGETPDGTGGYELNDSIHYFWTPGEGAETSDLRNNFPRIFYGGYLQQAIAIPDFVKDDIMGGESIKTETIGYLWNSSVKAFEQYVKVTYDLGTQGEIIKKETEADDGAGGWKKANKQEFTYNTNGKLSLYESYVSPYGGNWEYDLKYEIEYNGNNDISKSKYYKGLNNQKWQLEYKNTFIYNGSNLTERLRTKWDAGSAQWENKHKDSIIYHYNSNGRCDTVTEYSVLLVNKPMELNSVKSYSYSINGDVTQVIFKNTNNQARTLKPYYKSNLFYNYSYLTEIQTYRMNDSTNQYDKNGKLIYSYNANLIKWIDEKKWDDVNNKWVPARKQTFHYEDVTTGISKLSHPFKFNMYPNPASDKIHIEVSDRSIQNIQIINLRGQIVFQNQKTLNAQALNIPVSQLASGIYYLKINSGNTQAVKSFVVQ